MNLRVYKSAEEYSRNNQVSTVATVGTFDGFHRGHVSIFSQLNVVHQSLELPAVAITFDPHPRVIVTPDDPPLLLSMPEEKIEILRPRFDGSLVFLKFDDLMRRMTAEDFAREILLRHFRIKALVVGYNHALGRDRSGTIDHLRAMGEREGFDLHVVGPVTYRERPISSSRIRRAIQAGEWGEAAAMMGHPYPISGTVVKGLGRGKRLGWPTINLEWPERKLLPRPGVYSCHIRVDGEEFRGMMFIGVNMFNPKRTISVEAHIFDFDREIYGKPVTLYPIDFVRDNISFDSAEALARQIAIDRDKIVQLLH